MMSNFVKSVDFYGVHLKTFDATANPFNVHNYNELVDDAEKAKFG